MSEKLGRAIEAVDSPRRAMEGSDFIQAATAAWDPVFDGHWIEKGMYVASIGGSDASNKRREIDDETIRRADVYIVHSKEVARLDKSPDIWEAAEKGIKDWDSIHEIQDLLAGRVAGRTHPDQITLFNNNTGAGTQFAAVGAAVLKRAKAMGLGKELPTEWFLEDVSP
jgi:ornithine cyclodeaminase/alanine dehydrogenase-like protein (mu-crystallin family)